jgi:hypothetical protein
MISSKKLVAQLLIASSVLVLPLASLAQMYVQGSVGKADLAFDDAESKNFKSNQIGVKSLVGFIQPEGFAYEFQVIKYGREIQLDNRNYSVTGFGFNVAKLGYLDQYLDYRIAAGVALNSSFGSFASVNDGLRLTLGAGIAYKLAPAQNIVFEYDVSHARAAAPFVNSGRHMVNLVSIGYRYTF